MGAGPPKVGAGDFLQMEPLTRYTSSPYRVLSTVLWDAGYRVAEDRANGLQNLSVTTRKKMTRSPTAQGTLHVAGTQTQKR